MKDIIGTARDAGSFKTLLTAIQEAGLTDTLKGKGPFTVFAPNDAAFAKVPKNQLDALLKDKAKLKTVLLYHVVNGKVTSKDASKMKDGSHVKTASGKEFTLHVHEGKVGIDKAHVTRADLEADNGVIHVIDEVALPA
jgi:uncharacterized surface protein with fasciclin (FAS1) repeats